MLLSTKRIRQLAMGTLAVGVLAGCEPTHKERIKEAVKSYIQKQKPDTVSYQSENFGSLDTIYQDIKTTNRYQKIADTFKLSAQIYALKSKINIAITEEKKDSLRHELSRKKENLERRKKLLAEYYDSYEPRLVGYWQPHTYQLGDSTHAKLFKVDTTYKVVNSKPHNPQAK